jgi:uncharacterized protein YbbC (DUF1343 family)
MVRLFAFLLISLFTYSCTESNQVTVPGANRIDEYRHLIENRKVAVVANQTSMIGETHLIDSLINIGLDIKVILAPEHGFRELAPDGNTIQNGSDPLTGIKILSLYGTRIKPSPEDIEDIDVVLFDIQDVGVRFYTYLSTLHYVMEACAENNVECIVLDRPNPNGFYFDGNIAADTSYRSFVAMHPVPVVTGMTIGEYARMINGEKWLDNGIQCDLTVIKCKNYTHNMLYELPVRPSPNLPDMTSIYLYPSICFFEGTNISLGRGTPYPFQMYGSPLLPDRGFSFTPERLPESTNPPLMGEKCYGADLRNAIEDKLVPSPGINLQWLIDAYNDYPDKENFFTAYIERLAAGPELREQIQGGMTAEEIRASWEKGLEEFGKIREKYLLYP